MVLVMGWGDGKAKDLGAVAPAVCPNCHNDVFMHEVRSMQQFSLYWVPLGTYGSHEFLACPVCRHATLIKPDDKQRILNMRAATKSFQMGRVPEAYYRRTVEAFWGAIGVDPHGQQVLRPTKSMAPAPPPLAEQLKGLGELRAQGVLTEDEFAAAKKKLLEG
jgi:hypothetical protein